MPPKGPNTSEITSGRTKLGVQRPGQCTKTGRHQGEKGKKKTAENNLDRTSKKRDAMGGQNPKREGKPIRGSGMWGKRPSHVEGCWRENQPNNRASRCSGSRQVNFGLGAG